LTFSEEVELSLSFASTATFYASLTSPEFTTALAPAGAVVFPALLLGLSRAAFILALASANLSTDFSAILS
jgi:hypothetical protein